MHRPDRHRLRARDFLGILALALVVASGVPSSAQDREGDSITDIERQAAEDRERAEKLREKAEALAEEIRALRSEAVAIARRIQNLESELSELEATFASLKKREAAKRSALRDRRAQLARTLGALQRIAVQPPEALAASSRSPLAVVRGGMVLSRTVPTIERRAGRLRVELAELRQLRTDMKRQKTEIAGTRDQLTAKRAALENVMVRKKKLRQRAMGRSEAARERAASLANKAENMRDLLSKLRAQPRSQPESEPAAGDTASNGGSGANAAGNTAGQPPKPGTKPASPGGQLARLSRPEDIRGFPDSRASLRMPARGDVVTRYGEDTTRAGSRIAAKGIVIETRNGGRVVAPYDGKVVYAGPFKGYGRILIIEHGARYHSLLAGLDRIEAIVGQWVLAGEPLGVMTESPAQTPELYMELRRGGRPINPLPWLAQTGNKVKG